MNLTLKVLAAAMATIGLCGAASAATGNHPAVERALGHLKNLSAATQSADADAFTARDMMVDADGSSHVRFDRSYKGLRVIGGDMVVHSDARGNLRHLSHTLREALRTDTQARYDETAAIEYAQSLFNGTSEGRPRSQLVIYARGATPVLAYDVVVTGEREDTPSLLHIVIDANSLQLLDKYDEVMTAASAGIGDTLLSGAVTITTDSGSVFTMRDPTRSNNYTTDLKRRTSGNGTVFTDADNTWGNFATSDPATAGADAHYGLALTWDYYKNTFGRNGIDNAGGTTFSRVHYGRRYVNAFWSDSCFCMTYGDGDGRTYLPLVAIDVAGHEMSHGVTSRTAGLIYSGESGGLNEANSDIMGTMVEYYADNPKNPPNYLIGERIYVANNGVPNPTTALRYMFKPSLDGNRSPDCYSGSLGGLDVHYSSGVANHFFYLLAEGAVVPAGFGSLTPAALVCNGNTSIAGIGRDAAAKIWYRALTVYMTSNTNYAAARAATLSAAADLYGSGSTQYSKVAAAWSAVSVN
jgi:zinc metalloprotease ZmpA